MVATRPALVQLLRVLSVIQHCPKKGRLFDLLHELYTENPEMRHVLVCPTFSIAIKRNATYSPITFNTAGTCYRTNWWKLVFVKLTR